MYVSHSHCQVHVFVWLQRSWESARALFLTSAKLRALCQHVRYFWILFVCLIVWSVTSHARLDKSHNGVIFSHKARLLLDFSRMFQNVSSCEIMCKIKQSLFIYLSGYGSCHIRQARCHQPRKKWRRKYHWGKTWLSRSATNITELIFVLNKKLWRIYRRRI